MTDAIELRSRKQALRLNRFYSACTTYALGIVILGLCSLCGLFAAERFALVAAAFTGVNVALYGIIRSGWNLRFADPSLTQLQIGIGATTVALMLVLGEHIHLLAVPFYSVLFVFAMLKLTPRQLAAVELYVLATYAVAVAARSVLFAGRLDHRVEAINAVLVVLTSIWYTAAASYISELRARLRESVQTIERLASRDELTQTWNRRHIDTLLGTEIERLGRHGGELCVCLVDVDHFKAINDRFGHLVGDMVLRRIADAMTAQLRSIDQIGRFGGEEFLVLLPGATLADARAFATRLMNGVESLALLPDSDDRVTISLGVAECIAGETAHAALGRADRALYRAKRAGRNRVAVVADFEPTFA